MTTWSGNLMKESTHISHLLHSIHLDRWPFRAHKILFVSIHAIRFFRPSRIPFRTLDKIGNTRNFGSLQSHERKVGNRRWRHWTKISAKSVTKKNPSLPSTFSSKMPPCEMFVYFRNFLKKHLVTPYSSNGSGLEDKNRSFSFFSLIEKNSKHISSSIFSRLKLWQRKNRRKNWRLTKIS